MFNANRAPPELHYEQRYEYSFFYFLFAERRQPNLLESGLLLGKTGRERKYRYTTRTYSTSYSLGELQ